ncbi:DUF3052 domain-containing protein [Saxibacter everestensis]|uniref:DUF3052 domain-containing protein n=1 Tax=Saxibacter everestensis TaxID=2909229 RepID=A0ABY8QYH1_9MICO|nr:DUF3052 domain-containing protein [Brevibacteriaceae bacterium ZFBP1038]
MSGNSSAKPAQENLGENLGFRAGQIVQELGYDDDVDFDLRDVIEGIIGSELEDEDSQEVVDAVILWWRSDDDDLIDALVDSLSTLDEGGVVWLLTPKPSRPGHVPAGEISEAAPTAGMHVTSSISASGDWSGTRLVSRKSR